MNEDDLRDCFAMFASIRLGMDGSLDTVRASAERCYEFADAMLEARKPKEESGIAAIKRTRRKA